jgi:hypothetical protein
LGGVQELIHGDEGSAVIKPRRWKDPVQRKTLAKAKSDEERLANYIPMRQTALIYLHTL